jgi:hypothetical protein
MKKNFIALLFFTSGTFAIAQNINEDYYSSSKPKLLSKDRISTSITAGTSVSFSSDKNNYFSTFIAPKINYQLSQKFRLNVGLMHFISYPNVLPLGNNKENTSVACKRNYSANLLFVGGEYQLNEKLIVSGTVMMNAGSVNTMQNNYKAASIGLDYKVSEHSSIGIRAGISQGNQDYMFNPNRNTFDSYPSTDKTGMFTTPGQLGVDELNRNIR